MRFGQKPIDQPKTMNYKKVASARQVFIDHRTAAPDELAALEKSFFKSLCLPNGTHKTTAPARLREVDEVTATLIKGRKAISLLDVAISTGVTTLELLEHLERQGISTSGVGVDICVRANLHSVPGLDVLYDAEGSALQVATPLFARGRPDKSQSSVQSKVLRLTMDLLELPLVRTCMQNLSRRRQLDLVSPRLTARSQFEIVEHDICRPQPKWEANFDVVRAANILNSDYFAPQQISVMVSNLASWLKVGGILIVCSTSAEDDSNHGSFYRKQNAAGKLELVYCLGRGFERDHQIRSVA